MEHEYEISTASLSLPIHRDDRHEKRIKIKYTKWMNELKINEKIWRKKNLQLIYA